MKSGKNRLNDPKAEARREQHAGHVKSVVDRAPRLFPTGISVLASAKLRGAE